MREDRVGKDPDAVSTISGVRFNPSGTCLLVADRDENDPTGRSLLCFDTAAAKELFTIRGATTPALFSPDGSRLVAVDTGNSSTFARVFDSVDGHELAWLRGHTAAIHALAFTPDGDRIASSSSDGTIKIWEASSGREILTFPGINRLLEHLRFSAVGSQLIAVDDEGIASIWDTSPSHLSMTANP